MKLRTIILLSLAAFMSTPQVSAQSLKDRFKKAASNIGKQVKKNVTKEVTKEVNKEVNKATSKVTSAVKPSTKSSTKSSGKKAAGNNSPSAAWPSDHTALFAPIGDAVDAKYGVKRVKAVKPPKDEAKQPDWNDARPSAYEMDNQSLVEEYELLNDCINSGYIDKSSPASFRFNSVLDELAARTDALNKMAEKCVEAEEEDDEGFADVHRQLMAGTLKTRAYHVVVRSSIAPLFTFESTLLEKVTRDYFKAHGGYENAHKAKFTVYNP